MKFFNYTIPKKIKNIRLVWLSGLSASLWTKGSLVRFPVGYMPGLLASSSVKGEQEATTYWCFSPFLSPSFPLSLKINKILRKKHLKNNIRECQIFKMFKITLLPFIPYHPHCFLTTNVLKPRLLVTDCYSEFNWFFWLLFLSLDLTK